MGHGLKLITFYVQKHIAFLAMCHKPPLVRDKPLDAPASVKLVYIPFCVHRTSCGFIRSAAASLVDGHPTQITPA